MRGPSLLVINDGTFKQEHRDAITQINLGTKGTEERAIGRFGKGLKSVFAWCEAFFIIARTAPEAGWQETMIGDLFNPWHGWRHQDWEHEFSAHAEIIAKRAEKHFADIYASGTPWLAFWFPLRQQSQVGNADEAAGWIHQEFPGDDPQFWQTLAKELRELSPSLVSLRNLNQIAILDRSASSGDSHVLQFPSDSQRIPAPNAAPGTITVEGAITLSSRNHPELMHRYRGVAGRLPDDRVTHLKTEANKWPEVVQRTNGQIKANAPVKGEPHFATLIAWHPVNGKESFGSLDLRWCVFFPVGIQPPGKEPIKLSSLSKHITINLHGFFFLDSERLRIDGLEDQFKIKTNGSNDSNACIPWNRIVATQGVLANLLRTIDAFAQAENLTSAQCWELAEAMRKTWEWKHFQSEICQRETWRPRWHSGVETWECISAEKPVFPIPHIAKPDEVLARIPALGRISQEHTLVAKAGDGMLHGLHNDQCDRWPEELVVRLLSGIKVEPTGSENTIRWINDFLDDLKQNNNFKPRIADVISTLPLLPVRDAWTNAMQRVSVKEWESLCQKDLLFAPPIASEKWLRLLCEAFPNISFIVSDHDLPRWFAGNRAPSCDETSAARVVLRQANLGSFPSRAKLWGAFAFLPQRPPLVILALRYLMHADSANAEDETTSLWIPSEMPEQQVWFRVFDYLYKEDGGTKSKRLLPSEWVNLLNPMIREELKIITIDAEGAWNELMKNQSALSNLEFPPDEWLDKDIATLLQGLYQAGKSKLTETLKLLRRLRVHTLAGKTNERVLVAAANGQLDDHFVLHTQDFEVGIPAELKPIWQAFLAETKIIERFPSDILAGGVQEQIFQRVDDEGQAYSVALDWNYVVRRCFEAEEPSKWAKLLLQAFAIKGNVSGTLTAKLKSAKWLPLELGGYIAPDSVVHIAGLEDDLHRLLDPVEDGLAGVCALPEWVNNHTGFGTLRSYFPRTNEALELLGMWLADKPDWHLGLTKSFQPTELEPLLAQLKDFENLPIASLLVKLRGLSDEKLASWLQEYILPSVLQKFDYTQDGLAKIENILGRLQQLKSRDAFDAYLNQACIDGVIKDILPKLSLVNQCNKWIPAGQLIWPSENLDPAAQLCAGQAEILAALRTESAQDESHPVRNQQGLTQTRGNQLIEPPDFEAQADKLKEYLRPFENGNVGVTLPAALVAVLSSHPRIKEYLQHLLQTSLGQTPEIFVAQLFGERGGHFTNNIDSVRFLIDVVRTQSQQFPVRL